MASHAPPGYDCPFCRLVAGEDGPFNGQGDIVLRLDGTTAFVSPKWWDACPGHVIVVPDEHYENVYDISPDALATVYATVQVVARAIRDCYECDGTSTRQHNEPGAGQDVWHFHVHVFPRRPGDGLYARDAETRWVDAAERAPYAERLRRQLAG